MRAERAQMQAQMQQMQAQMQAQQAQQPLQRRSRPVAAIIARSLVREGVTDWDRLVARVATGMNDPRRSAEHCKHRRTA
jgi:hypothetical protein